MSGPKSSRYTLTKEQRRLLMEQIQRQRRMLEETARIEQARRTLQAMPSSLADAEKKAELLIARTGEGKEHLDSIAACRAEIQEAMRLVPTSSSDPAILREQRMQLEASVARVRLMMQMLQAETPKISAMLDADLDASIARGFSSSFTQIKKKAALLETQKEEIGSQLKEILHFSELPCEYKQEIEKAQVALDAIEAEEYLTSFKTVVAMPAIKKCRTFLADWAEFGSRYEELCVQYVSLCELTGIRPELPHFSAGVVAVLEHKVAECEQQLLAAKEQVYISESIDAVMREMGYDLIGNRDVQKRSGKHFRNELYAFGQGVAVNVTYSSDGSIAMELGGLEDIDRLPSADETCRLCRDMESFCEKFTTIEQRLQQRGVVLEKRIALKPPTEEYAQIIGVEGYEMKEPFERISIRKHERLQQQIRRLEGE